MNIFEELKEKATWLCELLKKDYCIILESSYVIHLPIWVPLSTFAVIFVLFSLLLHQCINFFCNIFQILRGNSRNAQRITTTTQHKRIATMQMPTSSIARNDNNSKQIIEDREIYMERTHRNISNIHKANKEIEAIEYHKRDLPIKLHENPSISESDDYNMACEYCATWPEYRISARKPIRS